MNNNNDNNKKKKKNSISLLFGNLFGGKKEISIFEEEDVVSP